MLISVFTPTYNRVHTLRRCFESLAAQEFRDFEWIVVDDGSEDSTQISIQEISREATFRVRYIRNETNLGKHVASNRAAAAAEGELFLTLDSDDYLVVDALEIFASTWQGIPVRERFRYSGVTGLCRTPDGSVLGSGYPTSPFDSTTLETRYRNRITGDKFGFTRTDLMRAHPFPVGPGIDYVPEGIVWNALGSKYLTRYINEVVLVKDYQADGFTRGGRAVGDVGVALYLGELLNVGWRSMLWQPRELWRTALNFASKSTTSGRSLGEQWSALRGAVPHMLWLLALPAGRLHGWVLTSPAKPVLKAARDRLRSTHARH